MNFAKVREHEGGCRESYEENPHCLTFIIVMKKSRKFLINMTDKGVVFL